MTLSNEDNILLWDHCSPAALLARAIIRAKRKPTPLELETLDCMGFAGADGKEIDEEAANAAVDKYLQTEKGKKIVE